jgi:hypothetical protein
LINIIRDPKTGITDVIHICYECDPDEFPRGKPIINDPGATKDLNTGKWSCSYCNEERINKHRIKRLGVNHPDVQYIIQAEDRKVLQHNDAAKRLNDKAGVMLMKYKRNRYTGRMLLSSSS